MPHVHNTEEQHTIVLVIIFELNAYGIPLLFGNPNELIELLITDQFARIVVVPNEVQTPLMFGESSSEF